MIDHKPVIDTTEAASGKFVCKCGGYLCYNSDSDGNYVDGGEIIHVVEVKIYDARQRLIMIQEEVTYLENICRRLKLPVV